MLNSKKQVLECPVCAGQFTADELPVHVNLHFGESTIRKCDYPGCSACIDEDQFDDHMLAHTVCDTSYNDTSKLNDSILAQMMQEEQDIPGPSNVHESDDEALAKKIQLENNRKLEEESFRSLQETYGMTNEKGGYAKQFEKEMDRKVGGKVSVSDYYTMKSNMHNSMMSGYDGGNTRTSGIINLLNSSNLSHVGERYYSVETDHFAADVGDKGWGCGYRNTQMLLSSLLNDAGYRENLRSMDSKIPSIPKLQMLIEKAWENGYDSAGGEQLGGSLQGSRKWIGTTEIAALLSWFKIKARVVDFHKPTGEGGQHPQLFQWICDYFKSRHTDQNTLPPFPLYIQHQGHSRTCVGCEINNKADFPVKLIIFDPGCSKYKMQSLVTSKDFSNQSKSLKKTIKQMKHNQFQLLYIDGVCRSEDEIQSSKVIRSQRIPPSP